MVFALIIAVVVAFLVWKFGSRRPGEPGFKYVHVNHDGSARELSPGEIDYLSQEFQGGDGDRPYIKFSYESRNGWGSFSGFIERRRVPRRIAIAPVNPEYDTRVKELREDVLDLQRACGDIIVENSDGSVLCTPNPTLSREVRFELAKKHYVSQLIRREAQAKIVTQNA